MYLPNTMLTIINITKPLAIVIQIPSSLILKLKVSIIVVAILSTIIASTTKIFLKIFLVLLRQWWRVHCFFSQCLWWFIVGFLRHLWDSASPSTKVFPISLQNHRLPVRSISDFLRSSTSLQVTTSDIVKLWSPLLLVNAQREAESDTTLLVAFVITF